ncbi:LysM peptidoglycan-binding domain-containing protein [Deinococcus sp. KSM4-11]|uniref:M23 family metallopeptidase n=1 Tax=Deinococcus sp. KSM4-11 TaxID=2568654 RepID=UPI0010A2B7FD|nr:M23 family metallopeptidase [Deinococcus sp. KSM4-11]THF88336.1 LysM peptidoglycan-binding domain-containing protein [Deinococcus sp. KSM4-11]
MFRSPQLSPRTLALVAALLIPAAAAQSSQEQSLAGLRVPLHLEDPGQLVQAAPDVTLAPLQSERLLTVVIPSKESAIQVGRRYGMDQTGVRLLPVAAGAHARLAQLKLVTPEAARVPLYPESVRKYRVRAGDTLAGIAGSFGLKIVDLLGVNLDRSSLDLVHIGEVLNIPTRERGVLVRIKPGQSALSLIAGYGADLAETARANGVLPTDMRVGDQLLLPGVQAVGFQQQLLAQREAEKRAAVAYAQQLKFERFLAWKQEQLQQKQQEAAARQEQYDRYLAWQKSAERQAKIKAYEQQVQFEAAQAAARQRARDEARVAAARPAAAPRATEARAVVQRASTGALGLAWPMRSYRITSRFGDRDIAFHREVFHGGVDLAAPYGSPIYAALDGEVTKSGYGDFGLNVFMVSGNSTIIYGHMSRAAVVVGQRVSQGQLLGYVGCSGICTGPHLHFEVRLGGQPVDPLALLP